MDGLADEFVASSLEATAQVKAKPFQVSSFISLFDKV